MQLLRIAPAANLFSKGRPGDLRLGEWVRCVDSPDAVSEKKKQTVFILGCPDDQGVTSNRGRSGAKEGPDSIRKHLYKMTPPMDFEWEKHLALFDLGNVIVTSDIKTTHERTNAICREIAKAGHTLVVLGGGHDFAAPAFLGFIDGRCAFKKKETFGLINLDPHLDVRELENGRPNSGTPFRQILDSGKILGRQFLQFGTRRNRNARAHFDYCTQKKVLIETLDSIRRSKLSADTQFKKHLMGLSAKNSSLGITVDMDSCRDSEGTSAAPVLGFSAWELYRCAEFAGANKKVSYFEIAETAPGLDFQERSSRIAAELIYSFLLARASQRQNSLS